MGGAKSGSTARPGVGNTFSSRSGVGIGEEKEFQEGDNPFEWDGAGH